MENQTVVQYISDLVVRCAVKRKRTRGRGGKDRAAGSGGVGEDHLNGVIDTTASPISSYLARKLEVILKEI